MTLTQKDLDEIEQLIKQETKHLPTKDEFFTKMDEIVDELKTIREAQEINSHRISKLEDIHPDHRHSFSKTED